MSEDLAASHAVVESFAGVWNTRDLAQLDALVDPNYRQHHAGAPQGLDGLQAYFAQQFEQMPDLRVVLEDTVCEGDRAVARISLHFSSEGRPMQGQIIDIWRVANGKLAEHWSGDPVIDEQP